MHQILARMDVRIHNSYQSIGRLIVVDVGGRFCAPMPLVPGLTCCLPCPSTDYLYPDCKAWWHTIFTLDWLTLYLAFKTWYRVAEGLNVGGLVCLVFLLLSFLCLPPEKTRRHYLSYCLIIAAIFLAVSLQCVILSSLITRKIAWVCHTIWHSTGSVLWWNHTPRHVLKLNMRIFWCISHSRRLIHGRVE